MLSLLSKAQNWGKNNNKTNNNSKLFRLRTLQLSVCHISSHSPVVGVQRYAPGLAQVGADEDPPLGGVHRGHRDGLVPGVGPVQVVLQPVQSQAHGGVELRIHQRHLLGGVAGLVDEGTAGGRGRPRRGTRGEI